MKNETDTAVIDSNGGVHTQTLDQCLDNFDSISNDSDGQATSDVRARKIYRLHRCFGCDENFGIDKMSICLIFCRKCLALAQGKKALARRNGIDRALNKCRIFLAGRI
jgi:hypothetical protein